MRKRLDVIGQGTSTDQMQAKTAAAGTCRCGSSGGTRQGRCRPQLLLIKAVARAGMARALQQLPQRDACPDAIALPNGVQPFAHCGAGKTLALLCGPPWRLASSYPATPGLSSIPQRYLSATALPACLRISLIRVYNPLSMFSVARRSILRNRIQLPRQYQQIRNRNHLLRPLKPLLKREPFLFWRNS